MITGQSKNQYAEIYQSSNSDVLKAKRQPLEERDHAIYYATFLNILHDLAMDQHGDPLDPL